VLCSVGPPTPSTPLRDTSDARVLPFGAGGIATEDGNARARFPECAAALPSTPPSPPHGTRKRALSPSRAADGGAAAPVDGTASPDDSGVFVFRGFQDDTTGRREHLRHVMRLAVSDMRSLYERFDRDIDGVLQHIDLQRAMQVLADGGASGSVSDSGAASAVPSRPSPQ
jgi:hypothetical protein